jgi:hypothetical protein
MRTDLLKIRDFVLENCDNKINWQYLSENPRAIHLLRDNLDKIDIKRYYLYLNPALVELFDLINPTDILLFSDSYNYLGNFEDICMFDALEIEEIGKKSLDYMWSRINENDHDYWFIIPKNPVALPIIESTLDTIYWYSLCENSAALHLLDRKPSEIYFPQVSRNKNPKILDYIDKHLEDMSYHNHIDFFELSCNPMAISLLEENKDKLNNRFLMHNTKAQDLIKERLDELNIINWRDLSRNCGMIEILKENQAKVNWEQIWSNPAIFTYDYDKIKGIFADLNKEIYEYHHKHSRMNK